jgi:CTP synthase
MEKTTPHAFIDMMADQKQTSKKGGTMRLGAYDCSLKKGSKAYSAYGKINISERHRHRYEFNNDYMELFEKNGMLCSGINKESGLTEIIELEKHPWFVGVQFHPEYKSTVQNPHPLFVRFVKAAIDYNQHRP